MSNTDQNVPKMSSEFWEELESRYILMEKELFPRPIQIVFSKVWALVGGFLAALAVSGGVSVATAYVAFNTFMAGTQAKEMETAIKDSKAEADNATAQISEAARVANNQLAAAQNANNRLGKLVPPIGSIVPYFGDPSTIPPDCGWVLCDGRRLANSDNYHTDWRGREVPNLSGLMLRGVEGSESIGTIGGSDLLTDHSHSFERLATGFIDDRVSGDIPNNVNDDEGKEEFRAWTDGGFQLGNHFKHLGDPPGHFNMQHRHSLVGETNGVIDDEPKKQIPGYCAVQFIIRVK